MRRDAEDRTDVDALGQRPRRRTRATAGDGARSPSPDPAAVPAKKPRARRPAARAALPASSLVELVTERQGVLGYRYRRLVIEQTGGRASVKELRLQLDYDLQFELSTKRREIARVRGRRLDKAEVEALWTAASKLHLERLQDRYDFLDSAKPEELDETIGADGEPIAVSTGEEGPACLTVEWTPEAGAPRQRKRIVIERFREPEAADAEPKRARRAPLAALCALVDARIKDARPLNYRKTDPFTSLADEFSSLRSRNFLNMRQFERRILEAFGALKDQKAVALVETELFAADSRTRLQALDALAAIGAEAAVPAVSELIYDDETPVREKARRILKGLKASH